jgi:D-tyrosyl-tRNA(Tyr) deacylase
MHAVRAVVQRVLSASVTVDGELVSEIGPGLLVLVAVGKQDQEADIAVIANKIADLRIFEDAAGKMNLNIQQTGGALLLVSQFTLFGDVRRGNRPSFDGAELPARANELFEALISNLVARGLQVSKSRFRAHMKVQLLNDGPVTILLDSQKLF